MRKIESQMNSAIRRGVNWASGNTGVFSDGNVSKVYLHGNHIATITNNELKLYSGGGWFTNTTKSRLNALIQEFSKGGIFQKNFNWFLNSFGATVPFCEGITIPVV